MKDFDQTKLNKMLDEAKFDDARDYVESIFTDRPTKGDAGNVAILTGVLYMRAMNLIHRRYLDNVNAAIMALENINKAEHVVHDVQELASVRASL